MACIQLYVYLLLSFTRTCGLHAVLDPHLVAAACITAV